MRRLQTVFVMIISLAGCHSRTARTARPSDLRPLVGHEVHLEGRFDGPGKLADYIVVPGGEIYLFEPIESGGRKLAYGSTIAVEGVLGYRSYPPTTQPEGGVPWPARPEDHYFINNAKVRVLRPPGGTS
jgi:hypothetical protein